ncbi:hypothetical protein K469DRAFT_749640 [Zopfia rhizophila CBS 207.26]|uniref:Rhodopsin domain-containing protein n=1 Tax=Zopfia rhizophila CBS 207.26 TaxID=1314779 RepID=A0A6A6E6B7_9PEZI|nr:hypothetical protein K469DRAFT_749640 [Zopfia rhizophila CBS 207.26]
MLRDYSGVLNGVMWTQVAIAIIFIGLRMYTRQVIIRSVGWDDIVMLVNLISFVLYVTCISVGTQYGVGKKFADVPLADYSQAIKWEAIGQGARILGIAASKGSVALFLLRIVVKKWHVAILWFCIASTTILCIITTTLLFLQCKPMEYLWDRKIAGGYCWLNFTIVELFMGAWSALMDFVLAILPWHVVMGLNMKRKEKLTVAISLSLGMFAGVCSIVRTYELQALSSLNEYVCDIVPMLLWPSTEVLVTIICACIPVLRPLYVKIKYGSRGDSSGGRSYPLHDYDKKGSSEPSKGRNGGDSKIYMGPGASALHSTVKYADSDNQSEESILREINAQQKIMPTLNVHTSDRIKRTDEISVTYAKDSPV